MIRKIITLLFVPTLALAGLSACTNKNDLQTNDNRLTTNTTYPAGRTPGKVKSIQNPYNQNYNAAVDGKKPLMYTEEDVRSAIITSKRVTSIAAKVPGVTRASAAAQGIDVVIGIDGNGKIPAKQLEKRVYNKVQRAERGYNIYVTADPTLHNSIRYMSTSMNNVRSSQVTPGIGKVIYEIGRLSAK